MVDKLIFALILLGLLLVPDITLTSLSSMSNSRYVAMCIFAIADICVAIEDSELDLFLGTEDLAPLGRSSHTGVLRLKMRSRQQ